MEQSVSKTKRKQQMHALQMLAVRIAQCDEEVWGKLELRDEICEAMHTYRRIAGTKNRDAVKRQAQYLGRLLRSYDQQELEGYFAKQKRAARYRDGKAARLGQWFTELVEGKMSIDQLVGELPDIDRNELTRKIAAVGIIDNAAVQIPPQEARQQQLWQTLVAALPKIP